MTSAYSITEGSDTSTLQSPAPNARQKSYPTAKSAYVLERKKTKAARLTYIISSVHDEVIRGDPYCSEVFRPRVINAFGYLLREGVHWVLHRVRDKGLG